MSFAQHAFISYAHLDNRPLIPGQEGWVSQFHATLETMLGQRLGDAVRIWRDLKLDGSDVFDDEIGKQLARSAVLISILTPRYVQSEWCTREVREFCAAAAAQGGVVVDNRSRIIKVIKTPVDADESLPDPVRRTLGFPFYAVQDGEPEELDPAFGAEARELFLQKLSRLAWSVARNLKLLGAAAPAVGGATTAAGAGTAAAAAAAAGGGAGAAAAAGADSGAVAGVATVGTAAVGTATAGTVAADTAVAGTAAAGAAAGAGANAGATPGPAAAAAPAPPRAVVFLAECARDLREVREQIATDLRMQRYEVLPAERLTDDEETLRPALRAELGRCALAIHLVGGAVGPVPEGPSGRSLVMLQNEVAAESARAAGLRRIIWIAPGARADRPEQQAFIEALQRDAALQAGADLLTGEVEVLKCTIHATLKKLEAPPPAPVARDARPRVHLLLNEGDRNELALPLVAALGQRGIQVSVPLFAGKAAEMRRENAARCQSGDVLVLFYGLGDEPWLYQQASQLRKLATAAGANPALGDPWTVLAGPDSADKRVLAAQGGPRLVDLRGGLGPGALDALVGAADAARRRRGE